MTTSTAVITGAAGGLGHATARQILAAGFDVVAVTRRRVHTGRPPDAHH